MVKRDPTGMLLVILLSGVFVVPVVPLLGTAGTGLHGMRNTLAADEIGYRSGHYEGSAMTDRTPSFHPQIALPPGTLYVLPILITNNQSIPTPVPFSQELAVNNSRYSFLERSDLQNIEFSNLSGVVIPSWLESGNSNTATVTVYWLHLNWPIPANGSTTILMDFKSVATSLFNTTTTGEAPSLSSTYGQFDDGAGVFENYTGFEGTSQPPIVASTSGSVTFSNGLQISAPNGGAWSGDIVTFHVPSSPFVADIDETGMNTAGWPWVSNAWSALNYSDPHNQYRLGGQGCWSSSCTSSPNATGRATFVFLPTASGTQGYWYNESYSLTQRQGGVPGFSPGSQNAWTFLGVYVSSGDTNPTNVAFDWIRFREMPPNGVMPNATPEGSPGPYVSTITPAPSAAQQYRPLNLSVQVAGGLGPLTFNWSGLPSGCSSTKWYVNCTPAVSGAFSVWLTVTDSNNISRRSPILALQIYPVLASFTNFTLSTLDFYNDTVFHGNYQVPEIAGAIWDVYDTATGQTWVTGSNVAIINDSTNTLYRVITVGSNPQGIAYDPLRNEIFIADNGSANVDVVNGSTDSVVATIGVGTAPTGVAYDARTHEIFVTNYGSGNLSVINDSTDRVVRSVGVGLGPTGVAYVPDSSGNILVVNSGSDNITAINDSTDMEVANVTVGSHPMSVAYDDGAFHRAFVTNYASDNVSVINTSSLSLSSTVALPATYGTFPVGIGYDPGTTSLDVTVWGSCWFEVLSDSSLSWTNDPGGCGTGLAYNPASKAMYVVSQDGEELNVYPDSSSTWTVRVLLTFRTWGVAYDPANGYVYLAGGTYKGVTVVNASTDRIVTEISNEIDPWGILYDPARGEVYVGDNGDFVPTRSPAIAIINDTTNTVVGSIPVDSDSRTIGYDPAHSLILMANSTINNSGGGIWAANDSTNSIAWKTRGVWQPTEMAYDEKTGYMFVSNAGGPGAVTVLNDSSGSVAENINLPGGQYQGGVAYNPRSRSIYVSLQQKDAIDVINDTTYAVTDSINVSGLPSAVAYDPVSGQILAIVGDSLSFINASSNQVAYTLPLANTPDAISVDPVHGNVFVSELGGALASITQAISGSPAITSFSATPSTQWVGGWTNFTANATGNGTLTYDYADLPPGCTSADSSTLPCHLTSPGTYQVSLLVTQGNGGATLAVTSVAVNPLPPISISSFSATPSNISEGSWTNLTVSASGGVGALTYSYSNLPPGCTSTNTSFLPCRPTVTGIFQIRLNVTDQAGQRNSSQTTVTVVPASGGPAVASFAASPATIPIGGTTYLNSTVFGGSPPYTYSYSGLPTGCTSSNTSSLGCTPTVSGSFSVRLTVADAKARTAMGNVTFTVTSLSGYPSIPSFTSTPSTLVLGGMTYLNVTATGGTPPYAYSYSGLPPGCVSSNIATLQCRPTGVGNFSITVKVTDTASHSVWSTRGLIVLPVASPLMITSFVASPSTVSVNGTVDLVATVAGGVSPYTYTYTGLPNGCTSANTATLSCTPDMKGSYTVSVTVHDNRSLYANSTLLLTVVGSTPPVQGGGLPILWLVVVSILLVALVVGVWSIALRNGGGRRSSSSSKIKLPSGRKPSQPPVIAGVWLSTASPQTSKMVHADVTAPEVNHLAGPTIEPSTLPEALDEKPTPDDWVQFSQPRLQSAALFDSSTIGILAGGRALDSFEWEGEEWKTPLRWGGGNYCAVARYQLEKEMPPLGRTVALRVYNEKFLYDFLSTHPELPAYYETLSGWVESWNKQHSPAILANLVYLRKGLAPPAFRPHAFPCMLVEWVDGDQYGSYLWNKRTTPHKILRTANSLLKGLVELWQDGFVHGDLRTANVMVTKDGVPCLIDPDTWSTPDAKRFGINRIVCGFDSNPLVPCYVHPSLNPALPGHRETADYFPAVALFLTSLSVAIKPDLAAPFHPDNQSEGMVLHFGHSSDAAGDTCTVTSNESTPLDAWIEELAREVSTTDLSPSVADQVRQAGDIISTSLSNRDPRIPLDSIVSLIDTWHQ